MTQITLVDARDCQRYPTTENLGLASIAAHLRRLNMQVHLRVLDTSAARSDSEESWWTNQTAIGFALFHDNLKQVFELSHRIKQTQTETCVFVGGHFATAVASQILRDCPYIDAVVLGDGEAPIEALIATASRGEPIPETEGLQTRSGRQVLPAFAPTVEECPCRDFLSASNRLPVVARLAGKRGCTRTCGFCAVGSSRQRRLRKVRLRSPASIVEEIVALRDQFGVRAFMLHDCPFDEIGPTGPERVAQLCRLLRQLSEPMAVECLIDGGHFVGHSPNLMSAMREAGFSQVMMLIGSGNQSDRIHLGKLGGIAERENAIVQLEQHDVEVMLEFFMLQPWSTPSTVAENIEFLSRRSAYRLAYYVRRAPVYPGTLLRDAAQSEGLLEDPGQYDHPIDYRFSNAQVQAISDALLRVENSAVMQLDSEFQDAIYLFNWLRVLFPQQTAPLTETIANAKAEASRHLATLFAPLEQGGAANQLPSPGAIHSVLSPVYMRAKQLQMSMLRAPAIRQYLLRSA